MKTVILAGGLGTRISEESDIKPKPMIEIGGKPILWHIMKTYAHYGLNEFIVCCGYKGYMIKEYFSNYSLKNSDVTFNMDEDKIEVHDYRTEPWKVTLVDTGDETMTGGRIKAVGKYIKDDTAFCMTYGDGLSNVKISEIISFHLNHGKEATITAVYPPGRFGALKINNDFVESFKEKPEGDGGMINGGFFVLSPDILSRIKGPETIWEQEPLQNLAKDKQLMAFKHFDFWQPMDTLRDKRILQDLWEEKRAPWKIWE